MCCKLNKILNNFLIKIIKDDAIYYSRSPKLNPSDGASTVS